MDDDRARPGPAIPRYTRTQIAARRAQARRLDGYKGCHVWLSDNGRSFVTVIKDRTEMAATMAAMEELIDGAALPADDVLAGWASL